MNGPPDDLDDLGDDLQPVLDAWDRIGLASGHAWAPCSVCGEVALLPRVGTRRCLMTPGCRGRHHPPRPRPTPLAALRAGLVTRAQVLTHPPVEMGPTLRRALGAVEDRAKTTLPEDPGVGSTED